LGAKRGEIVLEMDVKKGKNGRMTTLLTLKLREYLGGRKNTRKLSLDCRLPM